MTNFKNIFTCEITCRDIFNHSGNLSVNKFSKILQSTISLSYLLSLCHVKAVIKIATFLCIFKTSYI